MVVESVQTTFSRSVSLVLDNCSEGLHDFGPQKVPAPTKFQPGKATQFCLEEHF